MSGDSAKNLRSPLLHLNGRGSYIKSEIITRQARREVRDAKTEVVRNMTEHERVDPFEC